MSPVSRTDSLGAADDLHEQHHETEAHQANHASQSHHAQHVHQARRAAIRKQAQRQAQRKNAAASRLRPNNLPKSLKPLKSRSRGAGEEETDEARSRRVRRSRDDEQGKQGGNDHDQDGELGGVGKLAVKPGKRSVCPPIAGHMQKLGEDFADQPARIFGVVADQYVRMIAEQANQLARDPSMPVVGPVLDLDLDLLATRIRYGLTGHEGGDEWKRAVVRVQGPAHAQQKPDGQAPHDRAKRFNLLRFLFALHGSRPLPLSYLIAAEARLRGQRDAHGSYAGNVANASQKP